VRYNITFFKKLFISTKNNMQRVVVFCTNKTKHEILIFYSSNRQILDYV
jgi:hypothetical protein